MDEETAPIEQHPNAVDEDDDVSVNQISLGGGGGEEVIVTHSYYAKGPMDVIRSKFVVAQIIFNVVASVLGPLGTFYLLFGYLSQGPYEWNSGPLVGVVVGSLACSPILIFALMPVGLPDAVEKGWFPRLRLQPIEEYPRWMGLLLPILNWRWASLRNVALGLLIGIVYVPITLLLARFAVGPTLDTWTLIWFNVIYEVLLTVPVVTLGLLGYSLEPNLNLTISKMSDHPNVFLRILYRTGISLKMTVCPY